MKSYSPGSEERIRLKEALDFMQASAPFSVPVVINGQEYFTEDKTKQIIGSDHASSLCVYSNADSKMVSVAIEGALAVRDSWEALPFNDKAAIFLKAADLLSSPRWRYKVMAATMLGQGKNVWQAEIDAAAELCDFWRFNVSYSQEIYSTQPPMNSKETWNRLEWRPLEGFVLAISPFNFTAIGGNLCSAPALMGNVVIWKPAPAAVYSNYLVYQILREAGLPDGVIQFVPGDAEMVVDRCFSSRYFAGLHFTGSTFVFKHLWKRIGQNIDNYISFPRVVGETGGKNMHFVHKSADVNHVVLSTVRSAFEYQGQKCSACSRMYVPDNLWPEIKSGLVKETEALKIGPVSDMTCFVTNVINKMSYDKIKGYIEYASKSSEAEIIVGGTCDDSKGYFIHPTIIVTSNPLFKTMQEEIFGPVLTVFVYPHNEYEKYLKLSDGTSCYALTCALFAKDRSAIVTGQYLLRNAAGNFYIK
jgi:1-pyrroline-5-carboxylate dehydrogenase